jgi:hypothetical protein
MGRQISQKKKEHLDAGAGNERDDWLLEAAREIEVVPLGEFATQPPPLHDCVLGFAQLLALSSERGKKKYVW